jgi:histone deacetylase 1/2
MKGVMDRYRPSVVVMQLGADSLAYDKLGQFNLSIKGHGACLNYMIGFGVPLIMLGGGGYTIENVARCWAYETGVALGVELEGSIPKNDPFYMKYGFDQKLHFPVKKMENLNRPDDLNKIRETIHEYLKKI